MSETRPDREPDPSDVGDGTARWWYAAVPAAAFLLGILLGGGLVWVAMDGPEPVTAPTPAASPEPSSPPSSGATVTVPADCLAVAQTVEETVEVVRRSVEAVRELQTGEIVELLDRLEDLDAEAREGAEACRGAQVADEVAPTTSPTSQSPD